MKANEKFLDKELLTQHYGLVQVLGTVKDSRVKLRVKEIDRGKGWNEKLKTYTGVKSRHGWVRGENPNFGEIHEIHINEIEI